MYYPQILFHSSVMFSLNSRSEWKKISFLAGNFFNTIVIYNWQNEISETSEYENGSNAFYAK